MLNMFKLFNRAIKEKDFLNELKAAEEVKKDEVDEIKVHIIKKNRTRVVKKDVDKAVRAYREIIEEKLNLKKNEIKQDAYNSIMLAHSVGQEEATNEAKLGSRPCQISV